MTDSWRFRDEWIIRAFAGVAGITPQLIQQFREEKKKYFSHALIDLGTLTVEQVIKTV